MLVPGLPACSMQLMHTLAQNKIFFVKTIKKKTPSPTYICRMEEFPLVLNANKPSPHLQACVMQWLLRKAFLV